MLFVWIVRCYVVWFVSESACSEPDGDEGAGRLAEPLGKLTALQHLDLGGTV